LLNQVENNDENLKKLKASYDTLVKFAFLTREDEEFTKSVVQESRDQLNNILINKQSTDIVTTKPNDNVSYAVAPTNREVYYQRTHILRLLVINRISFSTVVVH